MNIWAAKQFQTKNFQLKSYGSHRELKFSYKSYLLTSYEKMRFF